MLAEPTPELAGVHLGKRVLAQRTHAEDSDLLEAVVEKVGTKRVVVRFDDGSRATRAPSQLQEIPSRSASVPLERAMAVRDALVQALPRSWGAEVLANSPESVVVHPPTEPEAWLIWVEAAV